MSSRGFAGRSPRRSPVSAFSGRAKRGFSRGFAGRSPRGSSNPAFSGRAKRMPSRGFAGRSPRVPGSGFSGRDARGLVRGAVGRSPPRSTFRSPSGSTSKSSPSSGELGLAPPETAFLAFPGHKMPNIPRGFAGRSSSQFSSSLLNLRKLSPPRGLFARAPAPLPADLCGASDSPSRSSQSTSSGAGL